MRTYLFLLFLLIFGPVHGQISHYLKPSLHSFIDNREFFNEYQTDQTFLANRFRLSYVGNFQNQHVLNAGMVLLQNFGSSELEDGLDLQLWYQYKAPSFSFSIGSIPWQNAFTRMPAAFVYDSLQYFENNLEGLNAFFFRRFTTQNFWFDWERRADTMSGEGFRMGQQGFWSYRIFTLEHIFLLRHQGFPQNRMPDDYIQDGFIGQLSLGLDLSRKFRFDSLRIRSGYIRTEDRARPLDWRNRSGWITELGFRYDWLGLNSVFISGDGLLSPMGDPFYRAKTYSRTDVFLRLLNRSNIFLEFKYSLHVTEGVVDHQQAVNLKMDLSLPLRN